MQPSPMAETSRSLFPSPRFCIGSSVEGREEARLPFAHVASSTGPGSPTATPGAIRQAPDWLHPPARSTLATPGSPDGSPVYADPLLPAMMEHCLGVPADDPGERGSSPAKLERSRPPP